MIAPAIPQLGLSVAHASKLLGIDRNRGYKLIHQGKLQAFRDETGLIKVSPEEILRFQKEEEL